MRIGADGNKRRPKSAIVLTRSLICILLLLSSGCGASGDSAGSSENERSIQPADVEEAFASVDVVLTRMIGDPERGVVYTAPDGAQPSQEGFTLIVLSPSSNAEAYARSVRDTAGAHNVELLNNVIVQFGTTSSRETRDTVAEALAALAS